MKLPAIRQLPSGNWFCRVRIDGRDIGITESSKEKCQARAMAYKTGVLQARREPMSVSLGAAIDQYIEARRGVCSPTTIESYEKIRAQYFQGLMPVKLSAINEKTLSMAVRKERSRTSRRGKPLSAKTIQSALSFVKGVMRENGAEVGRVSAPEVKRQVIHLPDPPAVLRALTGSEIELPCLLAAWLSLSMSEIRGLTKSKSVLDGKLYVTETLVRVKVGERQLPSGKTVGVYADVRKEGGKEEERTRCLDIPPYIARLIDQVEGDVLCPLSVRQIERRFQALLQANNLPHMTFHQLRHLNASIMAMLGVQKEIAQQRGGWKTSYTMDRVYTHVFDAPRQQADALIDTYISGQLRPSAEDPHQDPDQAFDQAPETSKNQAPSGFPASQNGNEKATKFKKGRIYRLIK